MAHLDDVQAAYDAWQDARRALSTYVPQQRAPLEDDEQLEQLREKERLAWEALTAVRGF